MVKVGREIGQGGILSRDGAGICRNNSRAIMRKVATFTERRYRLLMGHHAIEDGSVGSGVGELVGTACGQGSQGGRGVGGPGAGDLGGLEELEGGGGALDDSKWNLCLYQR